MGWSRLIFLVGSWLVAGAAQAFDFDDVAARARQLASSPYKAPPATTPKEVLDLGYDRHRDIRFRTDRRLWRASKSPFEVAFFHLGWQFRDPVRIHEVTGQRVREVRFDPDDFDYGANRVNTARLRNIGFAGLRVHYPVNTPRYKDEVLVFLGASYFRAIGRGQAYGASARGLALDTAAAGGEEFPRFTEFWLERPGPKSTSLTVYALLDSRRATGAYRFVLRPGISTTMDVTLQLFMREPGAKIGIAPLTSMFFFGENQPAPREDYRPEVHDSDGLSIEAASGEWIWRPLVNPKRLLITSFSLTDPRGFGLLQRDRIFARYEDLEARYERRPSVWVEPRGRWGAGRIELVQLPTPDETNDNVVAYWVPGAPPPPREPLSLGYRLHWQKEQEARPSNAWVVQTRRGAGYGGSRDGAIAYSIDFEGPALRAAAAEAPEVSVAIAADANGTILEKNVFPNDATGGMRVALRVKRADEKKPVELRANLQAGIRSLSETWSYILPPE